MMEKKGMRAKEKRYEEKEDEGERRRDMRRSKR